MNFTKKTRTSIFLLFIACVLIIITCEPSLYRAIINNSWSLNFVHYAVQQEVLLLPAPTQHPRAPFWLARDALVHNDPAGAKELMLVLANDGNEEALTLLGDAYAVQEQFRAAVIAWSQAGAYNSLIAAASEAKGANRPGDALFALEAAFSITPEKAASPLATLLLDSKEEPDKVLTLLRNVIEQYPNSVYQADWNYLMGRFYTKEKQYDEADIWFTRAIALNPKSQWYWIYKANSVRESGELNRALNLYTQALTQFPDFPQIYYEMAWAYHLAGSKGEAIQTIEKAIQLMNPSNVWYEVRAGQLYLDDNRLDDALKAYQSAQSIDPGNSTAYYELAWLYRLNNDKDQSIEAIESALAMMSTPSEWYYVRAGQIYEWAATKDQAIAAYREALKINSSNSSALDGLKRLGQ